MFYTIVGTQWGDEGKGKIVDWLSSKADYVARFQGGNNAGHTIKVNNNVYKLIVAWRRQVKDPSLAEIERGNDGKFFDKWV